MESNLCSTAADQKHLIKGIRRFKRLGQVRYRSSCRAVCRRNGVNMDKRQVCGVRVGKHCRVTDWGKGCNVRRTRIAVACLDSSLRSCQTKEQMRVCSVHATLEVCLCGRENAVFSLGRYLTYVNMRVCVYNRQQMFLLAGETTSSVIVQEPLLVGHVWELETITATESDCATLLTLTHRDAPMAPLQLNTIDVV